MIGKSDIFVRSTILVLFAIIFFTVSLLISYEGFQIPHDLRTNHMSITDVTSTCKQMDFILKSHHMSYEQMIRLMNADELNSYLTPQQIGVVEQCMRGKLPELSSYLTPQKLGFFEGLGNHKVSGKAKIITIDQTNYLRFDYFDIGYDSRVGKNFKIPELHVYLTQKNILSPEIYLDKLKTKMGGKNYKLPDDVDLDLYDTVLIFDAIQKEPFAKILLEDPFYVRDAINNILDDSKNIDHPKISSQIIYNRYGFLEGVDDYNAKGTMLIDYEEDEGDLTIKQFEVSKGEDLRLYLTKNGDVKKNGYWTLDSKGFVYISSATTNEVLRYSPSGDFVDVFVSSGSGGLSGP
ncbi:MAG: DM13 domain-containing protein, partial [Nitrosopumilus sp.]|uniref:DM13 domain-containing protein n=1 Tax=Nitrosopumilus sp. TaxID=2024843 RepID=UPI002472B977|nr:DM13 domain-containing protein [Nitrosopumilus sp.]